MNTICELHHQIFLHTQEAVAGTDITLGLIYTQEHQNIKKLHLFMSSRRRGYNLLGPLLLPEHGNTPIFDYGLCPQYYFTEQFRHELLAYFGMFGYV